MGESSHFLPLSKPNCSFLFFTIISKIDMYVKNPEELNKYANSFFHPKGDVSFPSKDSAQSVGSDDFSVFSDGNETSTDSFTSG